MTKGIEEIQFISIPVNIEIFDGQTIVFENGACLCKDHNSLILGIGG